MRDLFELAEAQKSARSLDRVNRPKNSRQRVAVLWILFKRD